MTMNIEEMNKKINEELGKRDEINKRIASEDSLVHDGDALKLVAHDGMGGTGLAPM